jgi:hypothetical protein
MQNRASENFWGDSASSLAALERLKPFLAVVYHDTAERVCVNSESEKSQILSIGGRTH